MRRFAPIAWLVIGLAACNAIAGLDGEFVEGDGGVVSPEAGTSTSGGTSGDGTSSSGTSGSTSGSTSSGDPIDAGDAGDAADASDAGRDADADAGPPTPFCPASGIWCDDFEVVRSTPYGWDKRNQLVGTFDFSTPGAAPGTRALRANLAATAAADRTVMLVKTFANSLMSAVGTTLVLQFDFNVGEMNTDYAAIGVIRVNFTEYGLAAYHPASAAGGCTNRLCVDETSPGNSQPTFENSAALTLNSWHRAVVRVKRNAGSYEGSVTVDGTSIVDNRTTGAFGGMTSQPNMTDGLDVAVGAFYSGTPATAAVQIDNVRVTTP